MNNRATYRWFIVLLMPLLCSSAHARPFDFQKDMGICAEAPHFGKNCVTVDYQITAQEVEQARKAMDAQLEAFEALADEKKLGKAALQYSSFSLNGGGTAIYALEGKATYHLDTPEKAQQFIGALKEKGFQSETLTNLMKNSSCDMPH